MHSKRVDMWATGVTLFVIATERHPFDAEKGLFNLIYSVTNDVVDYSDCDPKFACFL